MNSNSTATDSAKTMSLTFVLLDFRRAGVIRRFMKEFSVPGNIVSEGKLFQLFITLLVK